MMEKRKEIERKFLAGELSCNYMLCENTATIKGYIMPGLRPYVVYACDEHKTKPDFIEGEFKK